MHGLAAVKANERQRAIRAAYLWLDEDAEYLDIECCGSSWIVWYRDFRGNVKRHRLTAADFTY